MTRRLLALTRRLFCWHVRLRHHLLTIMAAEMAVLGVSGTAVVPGGMEEAVIRAALAGMAGRVGITLALAGMVVAVTGTAVTGMVGVVAGTMVVTGRLGSWPRDWSRCWPWTTRRSARDRSLLCWL